MGIPRGHPPGLSATGAAVEAVLIRPPSKHGFAPDFVVTARVGKMGSMAEMTINGYAVPDDKALELVRRLERRGHERNEPAWRVAGAIRGAVEWGFPIVVEGAELSETYRVVYTWVTNSTQHEVGRAVVALRDGLRRDLDATSDPGGWTRAS
jgi:hypothetical protein